MLEKNGSYFDRELCLDGHYILTGYTNDQFCNDLLQLTDVTYEIHRHLRYEQGFDAVFFLDSINMLYCYDQQSINILRGIEAPVQEMTINVPASEVIIRETPLGKRRRRRRTEGTPATNVPDVRELNGPFHMGRQSLRVSWNQVTSLLRNSNHRCALILSNMDSLITSIGTQEIAILEELQSYRATNQSIVVYVFRETSIATLSESLNRSVGGANNAWARLLENVLLKRIETDCPEDNRVISLRTPNMAEVMNLLQHMRLRAKAPLSVKMEDIHIVAEELAASCARQKWGLSRLLTRLERYSEEHPAIQLTKESWKSFTGEESYRKPMEELDRFVGLESVKRDIREWHAQQMKKNLSKDGGKIHYSRLTPVRNHQQVRGHAILPVHSPANGIL